MSSVFNLVFRRNWSSYWLELTSISMITNLLGLLVSITLTLQFNLFITFTFPYTLFFSVFGMSVAVSIIGSWSAAYPLKKRISPLLWRTCNLYRCNRSFVQKLNKRSFLFMLLLRLIPPLVKSYIYFTSNIEILCKIRNSNPPFHPNIEVFAASKGRQNSCNR